MGRTNVSDNNNETYHARIIFRHLKWNTILDAFYQILH